MEHPAAIPWTNYKPRERGILDLLDDILRLCAECRIQFSGGRGSVTETPLTGAEPRSFPFPFRNSLFRAIMARFAVLCSEDGTEHVSPYGGTGSFTDPRWPHVRFHVEFVNTKTADQHLELTPVFAPEPS